MNWNEIISKSNLLKMDIKSSSHLELWMALFHACADLWKRRILCTWTLFKAIVRHLPWYLSNVYCMLIRSLACSVIVVVSVSILHSVEYRDICNPLQVWQKFVPISLTFNKWVYTLRMYCVFISFHSNRVRTQLFNSISHHRMWTWWNSIFHHAVSEVLLCVCVYLFVSSSWKLI